jgi:succinate dehydrogenase / fumarate reductase cytochrome b subunit
VGSPDRPKFLNLFQVSYPPGAIASIAHRVAGVLLAAATPIAAYAFTRSIAGPEGFDEIASWARAMPVRLALAALAAAFAYHLFAGVRHLLMDAGIGASLRAGRRSAWAVIAAGVAAFVVAVVGLLR